MKKLCLFVLLFLITISANEQVLPVNLSLPKKEVKTSQIVNDLSVLHPAFRNKVIEMIIACNKAGVPVRVYETYRDSIRQDSLYNKKGRRVTTARSGYSKHQYGLAIDIYPVKRTKQNWATIGRIGESLGLRWGGKWKSLKDYPHFEYDITTEELIAGNRPTIPEMVLIPI